MNISHAPGVDLSCSILGRANGNLANAIIDRINALVCIIDTQSLKFVWVNRHMLQKSGYSFEELQELSSDKFLSVVHPEFHTMILEIIDSVSKPDFVPLFNVPLKICTKEQKWIWLLMNLNLFEIPPEIEKRYIIAFGTVLQIDQLKKILADQNKIDHNYNPGPETTLSCRQLAVLKLIAKGMTDREISAALNISLNTSKTHRKNIIHKLGFRNTGTLIKYAIEKGLV